MKSAMKGATVALVYVLCIFTVLAFGQTAAYGQNRGKDSSSAPSELKVLKLRHLFGYNPVQLNNLARQTNVSIAEQFGNDLVVDGTPEAVAKFERILNQIDTPDQGVGAASSYRRAVHIIVTAEVTQYRGGKKVQVLRGSTTGIGAESMTTSTMLHAYTNWPSKGQRAALVNPLSLSLTFLPTLGTVGTRTTTRASTVCQGNFNCSIGQTTGDLTTIEQNINVYTPIDLKGHPVPIASGTVPIRDGRVDYVVTVKMFEMSGRVLK